MTTGTVNSGGRQDSYLSLALPTTITKKIEGKTDLDND